MAIVLCAFNMMIIMGNKLLVLMSLEAVFMVSVYSFSFCNKASMNTTWVLWIMMFMVMESVALISMMICSIRNSTNVSFTLENF